MGKKLSSVYLRSCQKRLWLYLHKSIQTLPQDTGLLYAFTCHQISFPTLFKTCIFTKRILENPPQISVLQLLFSVVDMWRYVSYGAKNWQLQYHMVAGKHQSFLLDFLSYVNYRQRELASLPTGCLACR